MYGVTSPCTLPANSYGFLFLWETDFSFTYTSIATPEFVAFGLEDTMEKLW